MSSKEHLSANIKNWLQIEKEMKLLQKELKDRRKKKNDLTNSLVDIMKKNEIDPNTIIKAGVTLAGLFIVYKMTEF